MTLVPNTVSSSFTISKEQAAEHGYQRRSVPIITLDRLLATHLDGIPEIVKIDAEGYECKIMKGATQLIDKTEIFLLEAPLVDPPPGWNSFHEIVSMMCDYGYDRSTAKQKIDLEELEPKYAEKNTDYYKVFQ